MGILDEMDVMKEKHIVQGFLKELINEKGLASYGKMKLEEIYELSVDTLYYLKIYVLKEKLTNVLFVNFKYKTIKNGEADEELVCKECNEKMKIIKSEEDR